MADPNHIVLREYRLVIFGPCKTGNTSVRAALAGALGKPQTGIQRQDAWEHRDVEWIADHCGANWLKIGFARHPARRFASAYADQLRNRGRWDRLGLKGQCSPRDVARRVCEIRDTDIDQHWRSLCAEMVHDGKLVPDIIVRCEAMDDGWNEVWLAVAQHCGLRLPALPRRNATGGIPLDDETMSLVRARYSDDFEAFGYT